MKRAIIIIKSMAGLLMFLICLNSNAEDYLPRIPSADVWAFAKYGNTPVNYYTGTARTSIPIYTYKDNDFEIPISLDYASNGYRPNERPGAVGLGWFLNVGGTITREVRGIPDDSKISTEVKTYSIDGEYTTPIPALGCNYYYLSTAASNITSNMPIFAENFDTKFYVNWNQLYDVLPDIYHFNFGNHKGKFIQVLNLKYQGGCGAYAYDTNSPSEEYKIKVNEGVSNQKVEEFIIKTGDGYEYYFGNQLNNYGNDVEYSDISGDIEYKSSTITYRLQKIVSPNGRQVKFLYSNTPYSIDAPGSSLVQNLIYPYAFSYIKKKLPMYQEVNYGASIPRYTFTYHSYLTGIEIDNQVIVDFKYDQNSAIEYVEDGDAEGHQSLMPRLIGIYIKSVSQNTMLKQANMKYSCTPGNGISILDTIIISGEGKYIFDYYQKNAAFPKYRTFQIDHWGYYNGEGNKANFLPKIEINNITQDENIVGFFQNSVVSRNNNIRTRNVDASKSIFGMLKTITYPTGGSVTLEYEPHSYSKAVLKSSQSLFFPKITELTENYITGGLRIKKITNKTSDSNSTSKTYYYINNDGFSSGNLLHFPRYNISYGLKINMQIDNVTKPYTYYYQKISGYSLNPMTIDQGHIEYEVVKELRDDGSYINYHYTNYYSDYPDLNNISPSTVLPHNYTNPNYYNIDNFFRESISQANLRGKLKATEYCDETGKLLMRENIEYKSCNSRNLSFPSGHNPFPFVSFLSYGYHDVSTIVTKSYFNNIFVNKSRTYKYNYSGQLKQEIIQYSDNTYNVKDYRYVMDIDVDQRTGVQIQMCNSNIVNLPLKIDNYIATNYKDNTTYKLNSRDEYHFTTNGVKNVKLSKLYVAKLTAPISGYNPPTTNIMSLIRSYDLYDNKGNLLQSTNKSGIKTFYVWGYGGLYMVAKIDNISSSVQVTSITGLNAILTTPLSGCLTQGQISLIRAIDGVSATFYEYKPFVGLTKQVAPSGKSTNYQYDQHGKLIAIIDDNGKLIESYEYNYIGL